MKRSPIIQMASGRDYILPVLSSVVAAHFLSESSYMDALLDQINHERLYEPLFAKKQGLVFLDLGANVGLVSIYASDSCARIVAVEPAPETFEVLRAMTVGRENIEPVCAALAPADSECEFFVNDVNLTASSTVNTYGTKISVRGVTLTTLLRELQLTYVDVCKVDIEGAEGESLTLAELTAAKDIVQSWFIETHNCPKTTWEHKLGEIVSNLARLGYGHMEINGMGVYARR